MRRAADVHVFDEADFGAEAAGVVDERRQLVVVLAADDHRIELDRAERRRRRPRCPRGPRRRSRDRDRRWNRSACSVSRLTVTRSRPAARSAAADAARWTPLVVSDRSREAVGAASRRDQAGQIAAQQRLAAGEPHALHAQRDEDRRRADRSPRRSADPPAAARRIPSPACSRAQRRLQRSVTDTRSVPRAVERVEHGHPSDYGIRDAIPVVARLARRSACRVRAAKRHFRPWPRSGTKCRHDGMACVTPPG